MDLATAIEMVKNYRHKSGKTVDSYLTGKYSFPAYQIKGWSGQWDGKEYLVVFSARARDLTRDTVYMWTVSEDKILAVNGHAIGITPELDIKRRQVEEREKRIDPKEKEIYCFMKSRWEFFDEKEGYDPEKHDDPVLTEAAEKFGITKERAEEIYLRVEQILFGLREG